MELSTERPVDFDAFEAICCLPDDLYRLRWVSYAYHDIDKRFAENFRPNASWAGFARWSAYTISEALRTDRTNPRLEQVLREHALPESVTASLVAIQKRLRGLDDGALPTVLALGNRLVFHEVGWTMINFLNWIKDQRGRDPDAWAAYRAGITVFEATDFFRPGYPEWLREGMNAYYDAWWTDDPALKAQHVLRGNILIGAYEQWRVDAFFEVALDFNPGALVKDLRISCHDEVGTRPMGVRRAGTRRALRHQWAAIDWMSDIYAALLTRFVLTWDAPLFGARPSALRLGSDVPACQRSDIYAQNLEELNPDVAKIVAMFDRSGGRLRGSGARNWRRFTDRMSFIVNLFRSQQQNPNLTVPPSFLERRLLELQLNDERLDQLRGIGDALEDKLIARVDVDGEDAQAFAHGFVVRGEEYQILMHDQLNVALPRWVDDDKIRLGQEFFEQHDMEIASALFCAALPMAYTSARGSRVLLETAELVSDVSRRIAETGRLLFDVMLPDPEGRMLTSESRAYTTVLAVRGFHAAIRKMLEGREPWKTEWTVPMTPRNDGARPGDGKPEVPINQEDLLGTLTTFTVVVIESLEKMGVTVSDEHRDAYLHTWLVVGHLLGIDYDRLRSRPFNRDLEPLTYFEMQLLRDSIFRRHAAPSPSGQILTRALIGLQESALPRVLRPLPPAAIRRFIGDDAADMLEVPPAGPMRVLVDALGPIGSAADSVARGRVIRPRLSDMTNQMFQRWMAEGLQHDGAWADSGLDVALHLTPQIDVVEAKRQAENAPALWD